MVHEGCCVNCLTTVRNLEASTENPEDGNNYPATRTCSARNSGDLVLSQE